MKNNEIVSQSVLIREMGAADIIEYADKLERIPANQKLLKKCISCYHELTSKDLLVELNKKNG